MTCAPNQNFSFSAMYAKSSGFAFTGNFGTIAFYDLNGAHIAGSDVVISPTLSTSPTAYTVNVTSPANAYQMAVYPVSCTITAGTVYAGSCSLQPPALSSSQVTAIAVAQIGIAVIGWAQIQSAVIANLTVTNAMIASLDVGKLIGTSATFSSLTIASSGFALVINSGGCGVGASGPGAALAINTAQALLEWNGAGTWASLGVGANLCSMSVATKSLTVTSSGVTANGNTIANASGNTASFSGGVLTINGTTIGTSSTSFTLAAV
jgi:hypothetical protein